MLIMDVMQLSHFHFTSLTDAFRDANSGPKVGEEIFGIFGSVFVFGNNRYLITAGRSGDNDGNGGNAQDCQEN